MRIATWNVNSVRQRLDRVLAWLDLRRPDVLALQETKATDADFPRAAFEERGWRVETFGQPTWNGVALVSRDPASDVRRGFGEEGEERRLLAGRFGGVLVVGVYVPNGQSPDSPKFEGKIVWLGRLRTFLQTNARPDEPVVVLGDFNVAPEDRDVHDPEAWRGQVLFHPREHAALREVLGWGLTDLLRVHDPRPGLYTWWDYRGLAFPRDAGLRIDLALGTAPVVARLTGVRIERDERKGEKPSDHAPVVVSLDEDPGEPSPVGGRRVAGGRKAGGPGGAPPAGRVP